MPGYDYQLSSSAVRALFSSTPRQRRHIIEEVERLAASPFQPADLE